MRGKLSFIVLAGTEKGVHRRKTARQGRTTDYVSITRSGADLTPNVMITKDSRIEVEFEYSDKTYARSLFYVTTGFEFRT